MGMVRETRGKGSFHFVARGSILVGSLVISCWRLAGSLHIGVKPRVSGLEKQGRIRSEPLASGEGNDQDTRTQGVRDSQVAQAAQVTCSLFQRFGQTRP